MNRSYTNTRWGVPY